MQFFPLSENTTVANNTNTVLEHVRSRKITGTSTPIEILAANPERKSLAFVNRSSQRACVSIADASSSETPPTTGVAIADYAFIVPADSQGVCGLGIPTGAISVYYDSVADAEFIAVEGW